MADDCSPMTENRRHVWASGRVQGVWFRDSCRQEAQIRHVRGWVRNLWDGRVEVVLEGDPTAVAGIVEWCRLGPPRARVDNMEVVEEPPEGLSGFRIR